MILAELLNSDLIGVIVTQIVFLIVTIYTIKSSQSRTDTKVDDKVSQVEEKIDTVHRQVKSHNGYTTTGDIVEHTLDAFNRHVKQSDKQHKEMMIELASLATAFGSHLSDEHDPIRRMTKLPKDE